MNEPTSSLGSRAFGEVLRVIEKLAEAKIMMLIVTHEMDFALRAADEIMIMDNGVIIEKGPPEEIIENSRHERTRKY